MINTGRVGRKWAVAAALSGVVIVAGVFPLPSLAAVTGFSFHVEIAGCFYGQGPASTSTDVTWKDANGNVKGAFTVMATDIGYWYPPQATCQTRRVAAGDTIRAEASSAATRTFTVPSMTVKFDRTTDIVSGRGPAGSTLDLTVVKGFLLFPGLMFPTCTTTTAVDGAGAYGRDLTDCNGAGYDAAGGDSVRAEWAGGIGDTVTRTGIAPYVQLTIERPAVSGVALPGRTVSIRLRKANGVLRGTARTTAKPAGDFKKKVRSASGDPISVRSGNIVEGDWAGNVAFTVPELGLVWDLAANTVIGHCMANARYSLGVEQAPGSSYGNEGGVTTSRGETQPLDADDFSRDLVSGNVATFICARSSGDRFQLTVTIP